MNAAASTGIAVTGSLAAAGAFGTGAALQYQQARRAAGRGRVRFRLLGELLARPLWLAGMVAALAGYGLQALALAYGPLALVAPIVATDLLFALPLAARWSRRRLRGRDWAGSLMVAGGVGVFLASSPPSSGSSTAPITNWLLAFGAVAVLTVLAVTAAAAPVIRHRKGQRAALLAGAAGVIFGLVAAVTLTFSRIIRQDGISAVVGRWEPWALAGLGLTGTLLSQAAYQSGSLSASLPVIDSLEPISAVLLGTLLFGERLAASPGGLALQLAAAAAAIAGIAVLNPTWLSVPSAEGVRSHQPARAHGRHSEQPAGYGPGSAPAGMHREPGEGRNRDR
jgi:drug/metabolite transporter (DMT)-like permease